jgi:hypothetical protein
MDSPFPGDALANLALALMILTDKNYQVSSRILHTSSPDLVVRSLADRF